MTHDTRITLNIGAPILGAILALAAATLLSSCSTIQRARDAYDAHRDGQAEQPTEPSTPDTPTQPEQPVAGLPADQADYSAFRWCYGGFNGAKAQADGAVVIVMGAIAQSGITYKWVKDLSGWGISRDNADALVCVFVKANDGNWIGGKFDWVSTSRTHRGFGHLGNATPGSGYSGWSLAGVPNPTQLAFVVVDRAGRRRSNVIAGEWRR